MAQEPVFEEISERYLLGELSENEAEQFEVAYFADDALFERFQAVKDELLDAYARGELPEEKRRRFDTHFLASRANRRELKETQEFIRAVTESSTKTLNGDNVTVPILEKTQKTSRLLSFGAFFNPRPYAWQATLGIVALMTVIGIWFVMRGERETPKVEIAGRPTPLPTAAAPLTENQNTTDANNNQNAAFASNNGEPEISPSPVNVNKSPTNSNQTRVNTKNTPPFTPEKTPARVTQNLPAQIASVVLMPFVTRSVGEQNTLRLGSETRTVNLRLIFKGADYRRYSATIANVGGAVVVERNVPGGNINKSLTLQFPSALLQAKDYIVTLRGQNADGQTETIGEYYFRVERNLPSNTTPDKQP